jgi:glycine/D-amino acid oxidase-like deaminating enzyme
MRAQPSALAPPPRPLVRRPEVPEPPSPKAPTSVDAFASRPRSATPAPTGKQLGANLLRLVRGLKERTAAVAEQTFSALQAIGLATTHAATANDLKQLHDFVKQAIAAGEPLEVLSPIQDVAWFVLKYPDEARRILKFLDGQEPDTWRQKSAWMRPAASGLSAIGPVANEPVREADVVVIGGGLSAGAAIRRFAQANQEGSGRPRSVVVLERDARASREHAASLRNAGIVCTALDYVFAIDEAVGEKPVARIAEALKISPAEAEAVFGSLTQMMGSATRRIQALLADRGVDVELRRTGGIDVANTPEELAAFREAAKLARELGLDWEAVDSAVLAERYGIASEKIAGGLAMNDSSQLHPGKLVKALFDEATARSKQIQIQWETELIDARPDADGHHWFLNTTQGTLRAKDVLDAREAFAPYGWRQARYSQIHQVGVGAQDGPAGLGDTNLCHSLSYMRKVSDGKFIVGSGDFPISDPARPPRPLASVALYAAANFKKVFPDTPFDIERIWGGVFGRNADDLPVSGELVRGWHVVGGYGGSGLNLAPVMAEHAANRILGSDAQVLEAEQHFSPRRFFLLELRHDLVRALHALPQFRQLGVDEVRVELAEGDSPGRSLRREEGGLVFTVDARTLDAMNTDAAVLFGEAGVGELRSREKAKGHWLRRQVIVAGSTAPVREATKAAPEVPSELRSAAAARR